MPNNEAPNNTYPDAAKNAPLGVQDAVETFLLKSLKFRARQPLLYWLLGSGTPEYKMSRIDAEYVETPHDGMKCGNCEHMYEHCRSGQLICSQISGEVAGSAYCRLWESGK